MGMMFLNSSIYDMIIRCLYTFASVITEEEFIRGCMADRVLYQMLTADTSDPDR
jgi:hypothetical protein